MNIVSTIPTPRRMIVLACLILLLVTLACSCIEQAAQMGYRVRDTVEEFEDSDSEAAPPVVADCSTFRITAPLDGLANGINTIYWDGVTGATGYQLEVLDGSNSLLSVSLPATPTNAMLDLSQRAIGGGVNLQLQMRALIGDSIVCRTDTSLTRAWPMPPAPEMPTNPAPFCGNLICEEGEDVETCPRDCG